MMTRGSKNAVKFPGPRLSMINGDGGSVPNSHNCARDFNVIFLDYPVGVGICYVDISRRGLWLSIPTRCCKLYASSCYDCPELFRTFRRGCRHVPYSFPRCSLLMSSFLGGEDSCLYSRPRFWTRTRSLSLLV
ncbi:hypothetical protein BDM02DRAFT_2408347 [Thelephora ganbajun]|uniref:Uncharacterized protein n=1 Tax=Thelephora ganbajun TaxID=370292 RepID=A0ACB6ZU36_THEGA|nr:hypothetical protein BDM02DRAFT_2408347 [Thelephora ganbajun]